MTDGATPDEPHRSEAVQQGPPADLSTFPERTDLPGERLFRQHVKRLTEPDLGCWFFDGHEDGATVEGRFSLTLPRGTCYLASSPDIAARERVGRHLAQGLDIPYSFVKGRVVTAVAAPASLARAADGLHADASTSHRVTRELYTGEDYTLTGRWADALDAAGFGGLVYEPRFSTGPGFAIALFDDAGPRVLGPVGKSEQLVTVLRRMGIVVQGPPASRELVVDDDVDV